MRHSNTPTLNPLKHGGHVARVLVAATGLLVVSGTAPLWAKVEKVAQAGTVAAQSAPVSVANLAAQTDAKPEYASWFRYRDSVKAHWSVTGVAGDPNKVVIRIKGNETPEGVKVEPRYRVMVLYPRPSSAYDIAISKILNMFAERDIQAEVIVVNFQRNDENGLRALELAKRENADLIYAMGSQSTAWLWKNYRDGGIPVISVTSKDPVILGQTQSYDRGTGTNFAFTSLNMPVEAQMAYLLELRPELKNLAILVDSNNVSAMETQARPMAATARSKGIRVLRLEVKKTENARSELATMVRNGVATMRKNDVNLERSVFWITGSTSVFREIKTINAHSDRVPVLSVVPEVVKAGDASAALSIGISFESNAHLAALYGIRVLKRESLVGDLKVGVVSPPDIAINFRKVREIGLKMPFSFIEGAGFIYDYEGKIVRHPSKKTVNSDG
ncbi:MAG: ABC transporter substrate-binding protein [Hyphomicrobiaceae bacterium]